MADLAGSIFAGLLALFAADTGSGGLNESSDTSSARVRHFVRRGDPNVEVDRPANWPALVVDIFNTEARSFGGRHADVIVRFTLVTNRDANTSSITIQDAASARMYTVFDGVSMATQSPFTFSILNQLRDFQGPSSGTELNRIFEFSLRPMV